MFQGDIYSDVNLHQYEKIIRLLPKLWRKTYSKSLVGLLQKICEDNFTQNHDFVGDFLTKTLRECDNFNDFQHFLELIEVSVK